MLNFQIYFRIVILQILEEEQKKWDTTLFRNGTEGKVCYSKL